jgi:cytochrome b561
VNHGFLNDDAEYRLSQKAVHWATVGLLTAAYGMVWVREVLEDPGLRTLLLQYHRSIGLLMVVLAILRIVFRLRFGAPPVHAQRLQAIGMAVVHGSLYVTLIVQPLLGWALTCAKGRPFDLFGLYRLPPLFPKDEALAEMLGEAHEILALTMLALIGLHIAAAVYHAVVLKDGTFQRMALARPD